MTETAVTYLTIPEALDLIRACQPDALPATVTWNVETKKVKIITAAPLNDAIKRHFNERKQPEVYLTFEVERP